MQLSLHKAGNVRIGAAGGAPGGFSVHDAQARHVSTAYFDSFVENGARYSIRIGRDTLYYVLTVSGEFRQEDAR